MRRELVVMIAVAVALVVGSSADAASSGAPSHAIVPYRSIGGFTVGMTRADVNRLLGTRGVQLKKPHEHVDVWYAKAHLEIWFDHGISKSVSTNSPAYRTSSGIGIGSTQAAIKAAFPVRCFPFDGVAAPCETYNRMVEGVPMNMTFYQRDGRTWSLDVGVATWKP